MGGYAVYKGSENSVNIGASGGSGKKGLFLTVPILVLLAIVFAVSVVAVGLIVHFTAPKCEQSSTPPPTTVPSSPPPATPGPSTAPPLVKDVRLPAGVKPVHYSVTLAPYIYETNASAFYFIGSVRVRLSVSQSTNNLKLHADRINLTVQDIKIYDDSSNINFTVTSVVYDDKRQWYSIDTSEQLPANSSSVVLQIDKFRGPLRSDLRGLYLSSYTENGVTKYLATSQLQPTDARKTFPCFDEPGFKAKFDISLVRLASFKSISNMPSKQISNVTAEQWFSEMADSAHVVKEDFETTPIMSTYLLAFIVSQFDYVDSKDDKGREYRNWVRPEFKSLTNYSLEAVKNITQHFESYFNVPYPLNKTDQAAVPDFNAGAMENWGLIIYRESRLVFDASKDTSAILQAIGSVVSHELAHMWFGNLVTPDWWDDIWLNEGFASFVQNIGVHNMHPDWEIDAQFVTTQQRAAFDVDSKGASHPIYTQVYNPSQINEIFDTITYRKGATVLRMLHGFVGDEVFRKGVGKYLLDNSYGNTFHTALYDSLARQYNETWGRPLDVGQVMDRWIKQMGYPVLNCSRSAGQLTLTQNHFLSDPSQKPSYESDYNYTWIIPVTLGTKENLTSGTPEDVSRFVQWMADKNQTFDLDAGSSWHLLNLRSLGFYRVNYELANWEALIQQLLSDHSVFTPQDRARLLDDSFSLASAGYLDYSVPLNMTKYLKSETHLVPWQSALSKMSYLHSMLHRQSPEYGPLSAYMRDLLEGAFKDVGLDNMENESHLTRLKRELIVSSACLYGVRSCEEAATQKFSEFVSSNFTNFTTIISPDIRRRVLCEGVVTSFVVVWDRLFEYSKIESHPGIQNDIIRSLACTSEPWILNRYLDYALDESRVRRQDSSTVFSSVSANPNGLQIVWDYLQRNWESIQEKIPGSFTVSYFINNLADFNSEQKLAEMERFKAQHKDNLGAATRAMDLALENVRINVKWMERNLPAVRSWLADNVKQFEERRAV